MISITWIFLYLAILHLTCFDVGLYLPVSYASLQLPPPFVGQRGSYNHNGMGTPYSRGVHIFMPPDIVNFCRGTDHPAYTFGVLISYMIKSRGGLKTILKQPTDEFSSLHFAQYLQSLMMFLLRVRNKSTEEKRSSWVSDPKPSWILVRHPHH